MRKLKKIEQFILESYKENDYLKSNIKFYIEKIKNGSLSLKDVKDFMAELFYNKIIRQNKDFENMNFVIYQKKWSKLSLPVKDGGLGLIDHGYWSSWNSGAVGKENYNLYYTIRKKQMNIGNLYNNFSKMIHLVYNFSTKSGSGITFKTQSRLIDFCEDNDNLKFYFKDKSTRDSFKIEIEKFFRENKIAIEPRFYTEGFDVRGESFGMIMSNLYAEYLIELVNKNKNLTSDKILDFFIKNLENKAPTLVKLASIRYKK